ncbi:hypothetical protein EEL31_13005 [Brevibacillus laterosporus]|nr:hypothetical protein [Brevibacillus laterosporus]TPG69345.1 hypothetical protein EEL31_13005 [Brevibacillus laterosporus]
MLQADEDDQGRLDKQSETEAYHIHEGTVPRKRLPEQGLEGIGTESMTDKIWTTPIRNHTTHWEGGLCENGR